MNVVEFYSVRMRAAKGGAHEDGGKHISGGERLATIKELDDTVRNLLEKGLTHAKGKPDFLQIQMEVVTESLKYIPPLAVKTHDVVSVREGQACAQALLKKYGIPQNMIEKAFEYATTYAEYSGALLLDVGTGKLFGHENQSIRVSRMDWSVTNFEKWALAHQMLPNERLREALVLATKVTNHPATIAELCWSDDPDYIAGYVASKMGGYERITRMKNEGDPRGCRVFFINCKEGITSYLTYLQKQPVFVWWEGAGSL